MKMPAFLSGLAGVALGLALGAWFLPDGSREAQPFAASGDGLERLHAELRAIRELLEDARAAEPLLAVPAQSAAPSPAREPLGAAEDRAELIAALRALEATLRDSVVAGAAPGEASAASSLAALREADPRPTDLDSVRAKRAELPLDELRTDPELFGRSPAQVYERFGTPTQVGNSPGRVRWIYADESGGRLVVTFIGGYAAWVQNQAE